MNRVFLLDIPKYTELFNDYLQKVTSLPLKSFCKHNTCKQVTLHKRMRVLVTNQCKVTNNSKKYSVSSNP